MTERKPVRTVGRLLVETLVIALGVFLSLWADEWREKRSRAEESRGALERLAQDLAADTAKLRSFEEIRTRGMEAVDSILIADPASPGTTALLARLTPHVLMSYNFNGDTPEYDALRGSGGLGLVRNPELLSGLARYHQRVEFLAYLSQIDWEQNRVVSRLLFPHIEFSPREFGDFGVAPTSAPSFTIHPSALGLIRNRLFAGEMATLGTIRAVSSTGAAEAAGAAQDLLRIIADELH